MSPHFHPDLKRAPYLPKTLVPPWSVPLWNAALRVLAALTRDGHETVRNALGQEIWVYRPPAAASPGPALLWIHGGGLVIGHPVIEARFARRVCDELGATVALPRYRLGCDAPYPAALDDIAASLDWLAAQQGVDPGRIAIGGDSAGGGLAACLAIRARDAGGPGIAFQLLFEPMLDAATTSHPAPDGLRMWSPSANAYGWNSYLRGIDGPVPATASAARAGDLTGLPPAFIGVGTADLFFDEATDYAARLDAAGVAVEFVRVEGAYHGFIQERGAAVARAFEDKMIRALDAALHPEPSGAPNAVP